MFGFRFYWSVHGRVAALIEKKEFTEDFCDEQTRSRGRVGMIGTFGTHGTLGREAAGFEQHLLVRRGREPRAEFE